MKLYMFQTVPLAIIRSLFTVHSAMVYVILVCRQPSSRTRIEIFYDAQSHELKKKVGVLFGGTLVFHTNIF
jgi:hypothetical protein